MNVLLLYTTQLFPFEQSWYSFYEQILSFMVERKVIVNFNLFVAYIEPVSEKEKEEFCARMEGYQFIQLPDKTKFNTSNNRKKIIEYIRNNRIDCVFNLMLPNLNLIGFLHFIRTQIDQIRIINIIHNRPDLILYNKYILLSYGSTAQLQTLKEKIQRVTYFFYIRMLGWHVRQINRKSYRLHDCIVLLSESYIPIYERLIGKVVNNVYAVPNPMPKICSKIPIEQKNNEIIFVGHLTKIKRVDRLLTIWCKIQDRLKNWSLVIVGDGPEREHLESFALENNLERVHFKGYVKSIDYIDSAKILCLVSNFEGLPTVFLEAMKLGVIPIGYDTFPAIYDIIDNGKSGYIIPFEDEDLYTRVLLDIATDDLLRKELAEKAKLKSEKFAIKNIGMKWIEIICQLNLK